MWSESSPTFLYETSVSDSPDATEDGEEGQLYQYIFELKAEKDREENEKLQTPPTDDTEEKMTPNTTEVQGEKQQEGEQELNASDRVRRVRKKTAREKPWRKPGAKISDYFNYGFNEKSWRDYCRRQSSLPAENKILDSKIKVHKCHGGAEMKESCSAPPSLVNPSVQAPREPSAAADVTEGQPAPSGREGRRQCLSAGGNSTQVVTDMSPEEGKMTFYNHLPPSLTSFSRQGPPPLSPCATSESGRGFDNPSTSLYPCSSGLSALIPKNMLPRAGLIDYTEAPAGIDKDRSRERGHDKNGRRGRDRDRESCSSSYSSREERMRHRETMEERQRERRHSDESKGRQKPSCSSSSRGSSCNKDVGEDRDRESRRKRKRKKKNAKRKKTKRRRRKNKKTNKTSSADGKEIKV